MTCSPPKVTACPCCERESCCPNSAEELVRLRAILVRLVEWDFGKVYAVVPSQALKEIVLDARGEVLGPPRR
jgi:hypothetical protein